MLILAVSNLQESVSSQTSSAVLLSSTGTASPGCLAESSLVSFLRLSSFQRLCRFKAADGATVAAVLTDRAAAEAATMTEEGCS